MIKSENIMTSLRFMDDDKEDDDNETEENLTTSTKQSNEDWITTLKDESTKSSTKKKKLRRFSFNSSFGSYGSGSGSHNSGSDSEISMESATRYGYEDTTARLGCLKSLEGKRIEPVFLASLLCAMVMICCVSASVAVGFDPDARNVACLECQRQFGLEDNSGVRRYPCGGA
jgi:hypothetical protein